MDHARHHKGHQGIVAPGVQPQLVPDIHGDEAHDHADHGPLPGGTLPVEAQDQDRSEHGQSAPGPPVDPEDAVKGVVGQVDGDDADDDGRHPGHHQYLLVGGLALFQDLVVEVLGHGRGGHVEQGVRRGHDGRQDGGGDDANQPAGGVLRDQQDEVGAGIGAVREQHHAAQVDKEGAEQQEHAGGAGDHRAPPGGSRVLHAHEHLDDLGLAHVAQPPGGQQAGDGDRIDPGRRESRIHGPDGRHHVREAAGVAEGHKQTHEHGEDHQHALYKICPGHRQQSAGGGVQDHHNRADQHADPVVQPQHCLESRAGGHQLGAHVHRDGDGDDDRGDYPQHLPVGVVVPGLDQIDEAAGLGHDGELGRPSGHDEEVDEGGEAGGEGRPDGPQAGAGHLLGPGDEQPPAEARRLVGDGGDDRAETISADEKVRGRLDALFGPIADVEHGQHVQCDDG